MSLKEIHDRYAGSFLGIFWSILSTLFIISLYTVIFTFIFQIKFEAGEPIKYALYAICGLIPWLAIQEGLSKATSSITANPSLAKQIIFPVDILPIVSILTTLPAIIVGITIYLFIAYFINIELSWTVALIPLVILSQTIFMIGIGWIFSSLGVYFRDLKEVVNMILLFLMFLTPVLYLENNLPQALKIPIQFNPLTHLINMYRDSIFSNHIYHPMSWIIFSILAIVIFVAGYISFKRLKPFFANVL